MSELPLTGGCLCGGVRFELGAAPQVAGYCHCTRCQGRTGSAASAQAYVDGGALRFVAGEALIQGWRHPDGGMEKCFSKPPSGAHARTRSAPATIVKEPGATRACAEAAVPVRRWQRVQWQ